MGKLYKTMKSFILTGFLDLKMHFEIIDAYGYFLTTCMMSPPTRYNKLHPYFIIFRNLVRPWILLFRI